jgi:hypothetical protein
MVSWFDGVQNRQRYRLFSTKKIEPGRAYELAVRFRLDRHHGSPLTLSE